LDIDWVRSELKTQLEIETEESRSRSTSDVYDCKAKLARACELKRFVRDCRYGQQNQAATSRHQLGLDYAITAREHSVEKGSWHDWNKHARRTMQISIVIDYATALLGQTIVMGEFR